MALTLLAGVGIAIFGWIQQNLQSASRLREREMESRLLLSAQALVQLVNPMTVPEGSQDAGDLHVQWRAELTEPARNNASFDGSAIGPFRMGLYRLDVQARDLRQGTAVRFTQWQVGSRRTVADTDALP